MYLGSNGIVSLGSPNTAYISLSFPIPNAEVVAPFWVDVDLRGSVSDVPGLPTLNRIWYRSPSTPRAADVARMTADVAATFREC